MSTIIQQIPPPTISNETGLKKETDEKFIDQKKSDKEQVLLKPYNYLCSPMRKVFPENVINAFNLWMKVPQEQLRVIIKMVDMLHSATLLIDDIEDGSDLRNGIPTAHHVFGVAQTINCANYVYFLAAEGISKLGIPGGDRIYTEGLIDLHRGQGMEIYWRDTFECPTEDDFKEMADNKTGGLLHLAVRLMEAACGSKIDYKSLVYNIGIYIQVQDDYLNLRSKELADSKGFCEDLTEGKFSFPIIHSINSNPQSKDELLDILKQHTKSVEVKHRALELLDRSNTFTYCRHYLNKLEKKIREEIQNYGGNPQLERMMDKLSASVLAN